jgi:pulcherriminic acid synthase
LTSTCERAALSGPDAATGLNGVALSRRSSDGAGYRTYEVHQRERVGESTALVKPGQFVAAAFAQDPYPLLATLRENYPCYRNWLTNAYWITRYDDVTSVFADEANFESRPKRWAYGIGDVGYDLGHSVAVLQSYVDHVDAQVHPLAQRLVDEFTDHTRVDLATEFAARLPLELLIGWLNVPRDRADWFVERYWTMQRGAYWEPRAQQAGRVAIEDLVVFFEPLLQERRANPGDDLLSVVAGLETPAGHSRALDVVITLLEWDHESLHGGLANLLFLLLQHRQALERVRADRRHLKFAYLEAMRHSTPVLATQRFARHEVERFGRLLPQGALVVCSAAAANRDPRAFVDPDRFVLNRKDLCQREARGQFRADGLACGIMFGPGKPSTHPAMPEDRPRSLYAVTRDTVVAATSVLLESTSRIELANDTPTLRCLRLQEMHTCWELPVTIKR